jgi:hypothetical protein
MSNIIRLQAHRVGNLEDMTQAAFVDLGPLRDDAVVAIGIDCVAEPEGADKGLRALARHGYYTSTDKHNYFARHLKFVQMNHRTRAALAGAYLLSDEHLPSHIHQMLGLTMIPDKSAGQVKYRFVQMHRCCILLRDATDLDQEMADLEAKGKGVDDLVAGLASIAFTSASLSGHELLQTIKIASHIIRNHAADNAADTKADVYGQLCNATLNIIPPDVEKD